LGLGLVSSLFMGSSLATPAYKDYRQLWRGQFVAREVGWISSVNLTS